MIPAISTTKGLPTMFPPLLFIVSISIAKDGYEDYQRYKADQDENNKKTTILDPGPRGGQLRQVQYRDLRVG